MKGTRDLEAWYYASKLKREKPQFQNRFRNLHTRSLLCLPQIFGGTEKFIYSPITSQQNETDFEPFFNPRG
jgi:hypothetical protein